MKHRSVVANFIFRWSDSSRLQQQVALFRRSYHPNIRSYQGKYAPISGSIESDDVSPELAAEREVFEETQLVPGDDLILEFCGQPYSFQDEQAGRSWTVHAFGWLLQVDDSKIEIDWEHDSWDWFNPQDVLDNSMSDQCVPKLDKSLQLVYFGPNGMFRGGGHLVGRGNTAGVRFLETVNRLRNDIESGARVLAYEALKGLHSIAECFMGAPVEGQTSPEYWHALRVAAYHVIYSARPSMNAAIRTTLLNALGEIRKSLDVNDLDPTVACRILETHMSQQKSSDKIAQAFGTYIDQTLLQNTPTHATAGTQQQEADPQITIHIITISRSSTILAALVHLLISPLPIKTINLTILESRPLCEGANLASSLIDTLKANSHTHPHFNIRITPESHISYILSLSQSTKSTPTPTLILLGADRIDPTGTILNKTGSCTLAVLAKTLAPSTTKTVILSGTAKICPVNASDIEPTRALLSDESTSLKDNNSSLISDPPSQLLEAHPAQEVYSAWSKETQDALTPYLAHSRNAARDNSADGPSDANVSVSIENKYFETVPSSYIDAYITEDGEVSRRDILRISVERRELEDGIFGGMYV